MNDNVLVEFKKKNSTTHEDTRKRKALFLESTYSPFLYSILINSNHNGRQLKSENILL